MTEQSFEAALRTILEATLGGLHTAFPAQVQSFNPVTLRVELQPCLKTTYKGQSASQWPILSEVPVMFTSSGDYHVMFQPRVNSFGLCIVSEKSLDDWLLNSAIAEPSDNRSHDLSDAIFIPGLFPTLSAAAITPPTAASCLEIRNSVGTVAIKLSAAGIDITAPVVTVDGTLLANVIPGVPGLTVGATTHTHTCPAGGGTSSAPIPGT